MMYHSALYFNMDQKEIINLLPLVPGDFRMQPQCCSLNLASSQCKRRVKGGTCPTQLLKTGTCGGWKPREGKRPTFSLFEDILPNE